MFNRAYVPADHTQCLRAPQHTKSSNSSKNSSFLTKLLASIKLITSGEGSHQYIKQSTLADPTPQSLINTLITRWRVGNTRWGWGESPGGGAQTHIFNGLSGMAVPGIPSDWSVLKVNTIT